MSYANGTTHYNLPQTVGNDKRDWFDTNQAFADIDAALYGAVQTSTETATALETLAGRVTTVEGKQATDEQTLTEHGTAIGALQTTVNQHTSAIADVRQDAEDMISAYNEGAAETSTHAYSVGDYFIYNDVLYRATQAIAIGDTIVPNTNCEATNVSTELSEIESALANVSSNLVSSGDTYLQLFTKIINYINSHDTTFKNVSAFRVIESGATEVYEVSNIEASGLNMISMTSQGIYVIGASTSGITWRRVNTGVSPVESSNIVSASDTVPSNESWYIRII